MGYRLRGSQSLGWTLLKADTHESVSYLDRLRPLLSNSGNSNVYLFYVAFLLLK